MILFPKACSSMLWRMMANFEMPRSLDIGAGAVILSLWLSLFDVPGARAVETDSLVDQDPQFPQVPQVVAFAPRLKTLWLQALSRPESDLQRQAAEAIALAHRRGMPDLNECVPALTEAMEANEADSLVKRAAAQALIELDAHQAAPMLMKHAAAEGYDLARLVEPALARWNHPPIRAVWLERLENPQTRRNWRLLAIRGAAETKLDAAVPPLRQLLHDRTARPDLRLEAARAIDSLDPPGLIDDANKLTGDGPPSEMIDRLLAATILQSQSDPEAERPLQALASDPEPTVAALGVRQLLEIDPKLVQPVWEKTVSSSDAELRLLAVETLYRLRTPQAVGRIGGMLDDAHPRVRRRAQEALVEFDSVDGLSGAVRRAAMRMLDRDDADGIEQALLVLGAVEHDPAAERLVELLDHDRPKVFVTAAWALRRLAVPQTADAIFEKARRETEKSMIRLPLLDAEVDWQRLRETHGLPWVRGSGPSEADVDWKLLHGKYEQLGHLIEALTVLEYQPAEPFFREFFENPVPPPIPPVELTLDAVWRPELRTRAMWGLGHLHAGVPDEGVADRLQEFMTKRNPVDDRAAITAQSVRAAMAIALGRMKAESAVEALQAQYEAEELYNPVGYASRWALEQILGESLPALPIVPEKAWQTGWFLEPLDSRNGS